MLQEQFKDVIHLIRESRTKAITAINTEMINLYWNIGQYIHNRVESEEWGQSIVKELTEYLRSNEPEIKGFSDKNLWRMKQFYQAYKAFPKLSALLREISWTNNLIILSRVKSIEEKEFYLRLSSQEKFSSRELERQINSGVFERTIIGNTKLSSAMRELHPDITNTFKDSYIFDFLNLSESYNESDLQKGLISQMKSFILELGKDFLFIGEEYKVQVGTVIFTLI
jgi:predicted nuclease of restriction endonuclease-like (RecB) superfamily